MTSHTAWNQNQARLYMPDPTSRIRFCSVLPNKAQITITLQNRPGSNLDGLVKVWPNTSGPEASQCARIIRPGSGRMQAAHHQFPTFRLGCVFPQMAQIILCKTSPDLIWFWLTGRFWPQGSSGCKPVHKNYWAQFWPTRLSRSGSDPACLLGRWCNMTVTIEHWTQCMIQWHVNHLLLVLKKGHLSLPTSVTAYFTNNKGGINNALIFISNTPLRQNHDLKWWILSIWQEVYQKERKKYTTLYC